MEAQGIQQANGLILNSFQHLDRPFLSLIRSKSPTTYAIGPLHLILESKLAARGTPLSQSSYSFWEEDYSSLEWLDAQPVNSVIYVSLGSIALLSREESLEYILAWLGK